MLAKWIQLVDELRNQYHWLLFFRTPKMLLLYHLLKRKKPNVEAIVQEISFLCHNEQAAWKSVQNMVEVRCGRNKKEAHRVGVGGGGGGAASQNVLII